MSRRARRRTVPDSRPHADLMNTGTDINARPDRASAQAGNAGAGPSGRATTSGVGVGNGRPRQRPLG